MVSELESPVNELWLSPISTWEVLILAEKGLVTLDPSPVTWVHNVYQRVPFQEASLSHEVALQSRLLELPHQDPADRFLAATALAYDLNLVTADKRLIKSQGFSVLLNL